MAHFFSKLAAFELTWKPTINFDAFVLHGLAEFFGLHAELALAGVLPAPGEPLMPSAVYSVL
ncbi:MAG TPA: hypothetical protein VIG38_03025 [Hyphomicrobium sp.]